MHQSCLAIEGGGEFVDHDALLRFRDHSGDSGAELLADAEHVERPEPRRYVAEPDGGECGGNGVEVSIRCDCVNDGPVVRPVVIEVGDRDVRPELSANRTFSGTGRADDHADAPSLKPADCHLSVVEVSCRCRSICLRRCF